MSKASEFYWVGPERRQCSFPILADYGEYERCYSEWYEWYYGEPSLRRMCDEGVRHFKLQREFYDILRFDCFNRDETDFVEIYMRETYPDIPFTTTRCI